MISKLLLIILLPFTHLLIGQQEISDGDVKVVFPPRLRIQAETSLKLYKLSASKVKNGTGLPDPEHVTIELADTETGFWSAYKRHGGRDKPEHALAVAFSPSNVVLVRTSHLKGIGPGNLPETLVHETFHLYIGAALAKVNLRIPLWFNEGVAQWIAGQQANNTLANILRARAKGGKIPTFETLSAKFPGKGEEISLAYAQSLLFVEWLEKRRRGTVKKIISRLQRGEPFEAALRGETGQNLPYLQKAFFSELASEQSFLRSFLSQMTLFSILSLVALAAFVRYLVKRKRIRRKLEREEENGYW